MAFENSNKDKKGIDLKMCKTVVDVAPTYYICKDGNKRSYQDV